MLESEGQVSMMFSFEDVVFSNEAMHIHVVRLGGNGVHDLAFEANADALRLISAVREELIEVTLASAQAHHLAVKG